MSEEMREVLNTLTEELNILIDAQSVEEAFYGLIAFLHNGIRILNKVMLRFHDI